MWLTKDNITIEVSHPSDIARYKRLGYAEAKTKNAPKKADEQPAEEKAVKDGS